MSNCIMIGCDLHKKTMVLKYTVDRGAIQSQTFANDRPGRQTLVQAFHRLQQEQRAGRILFAYEASSEGFGLYDDLRAAGIECYVLAPTRIARSSKQSRSKNDARDALLILELLRGHVLAGNALPAVWIPDRQTRDDRELLRMRREMSDQRVAGKNQIQALLKRNQVVRPSQTGKGWTNGHWAWLEGLAEGRVAGLGAGAQAALSVLLDQMQALDGQVQRLDEKVETLSASPRYAQAVGWLRTIKGVGILSAMVFLTELGDLSRFANRRQLAAYLGLVPTSSESGERDDCKGHITRQGPGRVRQILCQCVWSQIRGDTDLGACYAKLVQRNPKHRKIAVVAIMRRLAIVMWHRAQYGPPPNVQEPPAKVA
jgi:transposase